MVKSISFILSGSGRDPVGGFRIVYEYANRLAEKGWKVTVIHPLRVWNVKRSIIDRSRQVLIYFYCLLFRLYLPTRWFLIHPGIRMLWVPNLNEFYIPRSDFIVACPVESAFFVNSYAANKGKKIYFIQHFEDWALPKEQVEESWKFPLKKIVIAKWLQNIAIGLGEDAQYIPNGLDFSFFTANIPFNKRPLHSILFISHILEIKGTKYAVDASKIIKALYPDIVIKTFSIYPKPKDFPEFIEYYQNPAQESLRELYNSSAIFLSPSLSEGWPLPPAEAMMCGCVVVATDIGGHREYIEDGINGYFCTPGTSDSIVEKIEWVFKNQGEAERISRSAPDSLRKFDWDSRTTLFEKTLLSE